MPWPTCTRSTPGCSTWPPRRATTSPPASPRSACGCSPGARCSPRPPPCGPRPPTGCTSSRPTSCWSPPAPPPGSWTPLAPTGSGSSPGSRSTTSTPCPSGSSSWARVSPGPSSPRPTSGSARRSCWSPRATGCCPARTPTPPRSSRTSSPSGGWRCSAGRGWPSVERTADGVVVRLEDGREVLGSHALLAVGSVPQTSGIGLEERRGRAHGIRARRGRPGLAHLGARRLRRG